MLYIAYWLLYTAKGVSAMSPLRMFGLVSAVAILLVTLLYALGLCIHYRSSISVHLSIILLALAADEAKYWGQKAGDLKSPSGSKNSVKKIGATEVLEGFGISPNILN